MKQSELITAIFNRVPLLPMVYLGVAGETRRNEAKDKKSASETFMVKHSLLWGKMTFEVTKFVETEKEVLNCKPLVAPFTLVAVKVDSIEITKWGNRIKGEINTVEA